MIKKLTAFCESFSTPPSPELLELERETYLKTLSPQMLTGHLQGQFLTMLSSLMRPAAILEIGTFTGYASICLAKGLLPEGILHTIEINPEVAWLCRKYFKKADLQEKIRLHLGDAREIVPDLKENFDLIYLDANKNDYAFFYDLVFEKVKPGGVILADNVLWDGKIQAKSSDADSRNMLAFIQNVQADPRVENIILPIRDGLLMARKL